MVVTVVYMIVTIVKTLFSFIVIIIFLKHRSI